MICNLHIYLLVFSSKSTICFFSPFHFTEELIAQKGFIGFSYYTDILQCNFDFPMPAPLFEFCVFVTPPLRTYRQYVPTLVEAKPKNSHDWPSAYLVEVQTRNAMEPYYS